MLSTSGIGGQRLHLMLLSGRVSLMYTIPWRNELEQTLLQFRYDRTRHI